MTADASFRPAYGDYQDAWEAADLGPLAREIAAQHFEADPLDKAQHEIAAHTREGRYDDQDAVQLVLRALKWRFYAQPDFRAAVSK